MNMNQQGFTLIEMMIVLVIIAILASIAVPNYQGYLRRSACEDAKGTLIGAANVMERFRAQNNTYPTVANSAAALGAYAASPVDGETKQTDIVITASNANSYTLRATPRATGRLNGLGTLTITSAGVRGGTGQLFNAAAVPPTWANCGGL